jgi:hypothetical protein
MPLFWFGMFHHRIANARAMTGARNATRSVLRSQDINRAETVSSLPGRNRKRKKEKRRVSSIWPPRIPFSRISRGPCLVRGLISSQRGMTHRRPFAQEFEHAGSVQFANPRSQNSVAKAQCRRMGGGEGGIRTPETLSSLHAFQACALSRARPPLRA